MVRLWTDPEVRRFVGGPVPEEEVRRRRRQFAPVPNAFVVARRDDAAPIGSLHVDAAARPR